MSGVHVTLTPEEREALVKLALSELRAPRDQVRYIIRQELERRGLLALAEARCDADHGRQREVLGCLSA